MILKKLILGSIIFIFFNGCTGGISQPELSSMHNKCMNGNMFYCDKLADYYGGHNKNQDLEIMYRKKECELGSTTGCYNMNILLALKKTGLI